MIIRINYSCLHLWIRIPYSFRLSFYSEIGLLRDKDGPLPLLYNAFSATLVPISKYDANANQMLLLL